MLKNTVLALGLLATTGCGVAYVSSSVSATNDSVRVIPLTAETVLAANRSSYEPTSLPSIFFQTAGAGSGLRGAGAPPAPTLDRPSRPGTLALRVPPSPPSGPYEIGIGDVLILATKGAASTVEELSGLLAAQNRRQGYTVQDDGAIAIPDVGRVMIAGLTIEEAESRLFQRLLDSQIDPAFSLEIAEFNSKSVTTGGAVGNPAVIPITLRPLTLDQALSASGGIQVDDLDFASIRLYRDGTLYQIPVNSYLAQPNLQKIRLVAGDSLFVDTEYDLQQAQAYFTEQITLAQFRQQAQAEALATLQAEITLRRAALSEARENFRAQSELDAVERDYAYVTGEVAEPGRFTFPFGRTPTLADALAGGIALETGNPSQIYVLRGSEQLDQFGAVTAWHLDARNASNYVLATKFELRPKDVIFVAAQPVARWNRAVSLMIPPLVTFGASAATQLR